MKIVPGDKPAGMPYPLDKVKEFLRVTGTDQDGVITRMINAAADMIERETWFVFGSRSYVGYFDDFPPEAIFHKYPVSAVSSVTYYDTNNAQQTLSTSDYWTDLTSDHARIYFENAPNVYDDRYDAVQINFTAGYANWYDYPDDYVQLLMIVVHDLYDNRMTNMMGNNSQVQSKIVTNLMSSLSKRLPI